MFPEIGPKARLLVCSVWIVGQAALVATGSRRADGAFAFRMFAESSTISVELSRDVVTGHGTERVPVIDGTWLARDARGVLHRFRWDDRVKDPNLYPYGQPVHASYGAAAQLDRLAHALDDVATRSGDDGDTVRLIATVTVRKNGGHPEQVHLESRSRSR